MVIKVGDSLPDNVTLYEGDVSTTVTMSQLVTGKKVLLVGVPGAFTPTCSEKHLPGYVGNLDLYKSKGIEEIAFISVNDPFVMKAWGASVGATNKIRMLADPRAEFTKAIGMDVDLTAVLGTVRSKRYAIVVEGLKVTKVFEEPDGTGLTCSASGNVIDKI